MTFGRKLIDKSQGQGAGVNGQGSMVRSNKNPAFEDQTHYSRPTGSSGRASLITHFRESSIVRRESGTANIIALDFDFKLFSSLEHSHHSLSVRSH